MLAHPEPRGTRRARRRDRYRRFRELDTRRCSYPELYYPEIYVLDGGYKRFYSEYPVRSRRVPARSQCTQ